MNKNSKIIIAIIAVWIILLIGIALFKNIGKNNKNENMQTEVTEENTTQEEFVQKLEDGSKLNISEKLKEERKLGNLEIKNIQLREEGKITTLIADVENPTKVKTEKKKVKVEILDKQGNVITELKGIIDPIEANGKAQINMAVTADVANAYDFKVSKR